MQLAEEFTAKRRHGLPVSIDEYATRYPQWASEILELFPAIVMLETVAEVSPAIPDEFRNAYDSNLGGYERCPPLHEVHEKLLTGMEFGDFRLGKRIGQGGMGVVYEAEQLSLARIVALKVLNDTLSRRKHRIRFQREARIAASLHHTNIVPVYGYGEHQGRLYYAMPLVDGIGLDTMIKSLRSLPANGDSDHHDQNREHNRDLASDEVNQLADDQERQFALSLLQTTEGAVSALHAQQGFSEKNLRWSNLYEGAAKLGVQAASALAYAHANGVLHRDIKPGNLMVDRVGRLRITDFGLARYEADENLTDSGDIVGTLRYLPPEAFTSALDQTSDQYSLGITLYELLTLRAAFQEDSRPRLIKKILDGKLPRIDSISPRCPRDLATIIQKATAVDPRDRYETAMGFGEDLRRFLSDEPILARNQNVLEASVRFVRRYPIGTALTALSMLLLAAIAVTSIVFAYNYDEQRSLAQIAQRTTEQREAEAKENLSLAIAAVDQFCDRVSQDVRLAQYDLLDLKKELLANAADFHRQLLDKQESSPESQLNLARAYVRLGRITGEIESKQQAVEWMEKGIAVYSELLAGSPGDVVVESEAIEESIRYANLLSLAGQSQKSEHVFLAVIETTEQFVAQSATRAAKLLLVEAMSGYSAFLTSTENNITKTEQLAASEELLRKSLAIVNAILVEDPDYALCKELKANTEVSLGRMLMHSANIRRYKEAEPFLEDAVAVLGGLHREYPEEERYSGGLAGALTQYAIWLKFANRRELAEEKLVEAIAVQRRLIDRHPSINVYRVRMGNMLNALSEMRIFEDGFDTANEVAQEAVFHLELVCSLDPSDLGAMGSFGVALNQLGQCEAKVGNFEKALVCFSKAVSMLNIENESKRTNNRVRLSGTLEERAKVLCKLGRIDEAILDGERAVALINPNSMLTPNVELHLARMYAQNGQWKRATEYAEQITSKLDLRRPSGVRHHCMSAAEVYAYCLAAIQTDDQLSADQRRALHEQYQARTLDWIEQAIDLGFNERDALLDKESMKGLHSNARFKELADRL